MKYEVKRKIDLPQGGSVTVTVRSDELIREEDFLILRPQAAVEAASCLMNLAEAFSPSSRCTPSAPPRSTPPRP